MARKANALLQLRRYDESIELYQKALIESNEYSIKQGLERAKKLK